MPTQRFRALALATFVPFMMAADGDGCSGPQSLGNDDPDQSPIANPTGDCAAPSGTGDIECYSVSEAGTEWVVDCEHPADRYYWRVHVPAVEPGTKTAVTAYMLPRPDGTGLQFGICGGADATLDALFDSYGLCQENLGPAGVDAINNMPLADALAISHALHDRLEFTAVPYIDGLYTISPWALPRDLEDACAATGDGGIIAKCSPVVDAYCGETDIGVEPSFTQAEAAAVAEQLNALYGVD